MNGSIPQDPSAAGTGTGTGTDAGVVDPDAVESGGVTVELQSILLGAEGIEAFLTEVARWAAGTVDRAQACGVTVQATPSSRMLGATTDEFAQRMDAAQYAVDDGPCLHAMRHGVTVLVDDIASDEQWPAFSARGRKEGAGASLSVPLVVLGTSVGALNLYSRKPFGLTVEDQARAAQFAHQAAGAVALGLQLAERENREQHLEVALRSRTIIDQAIGVLMGQAGIGPDEAFGILRIRSQHTNVKLRDVAAAVLADVTRKR
ncbi:GAF and ANTAR domain-containing protein [Pseudonocardia sp. GCM10023141]